MTTIEAPHLDRKLVAILAADVEGYSRLMHDDEEGTLATLTNHRNVLDKMIADSRGQIAGSAGDSVLAEFASVVDAVRCAVAIQQALAKANLSLDPDRRMAFRIGINVGDVMVKDGSIFGDGVNIAARLEAIADAGGICITRGVRDHLRDRSEYQFEDLGEHAVKNIARPIRVFRVVFDVEGSTPLETSEPLKDDEPPVVSLAHSSSREDATELLFWQTIQSSNAPDEYRAYLKRFPTGVFSDLARSRVENSTGQDGSTAGDATEIAYWETVAMSDDPDMYKAYMEKYPTGEFSSLAGIWLASNR